MSNRRILFIVEGQRSEPRFLNKMHELLLGTKLENIHVLGRSIHQLLREIVVNGHIDDDLDIVSLLREDANEDELVILSHDFSDVYLVFDMDPQDTVYDDLRLREAIRYFDNSTENGKLYLNYPMVESYRHLREPYDEGYLDRKVSMDEIRCGYKQLVDREACSRFKDLGKYCCEDLFTIIGLNLRKVNGIIGKCTDLPEEDVYLAWDLSDLLDEQIGLLEAEGSIHVVNTSSFIVVDYNPKVMLERISDSYREH